jgi:cytochrome c5
MAKKMEQACTACHGPSLIAQQRLDRNGWSRELDKMIRWGASVAPADKDALLAYLARTFNSSRPVPNTFKAVPAGKGAEIYQTYCLSCHDDRVITSRTNTDKAGWTRLVDQMVEWGAYVPTGRTEELLDYLSAHFGK